MHILYNILWIHGVQFQYYIISYQAYQIKEDIKSTKKYV